MDQEHDQTEHGGARAPGHDAAHWDERYSATEQLWAPTPNATVEEVVAPLRPGSALDLGAGEGRHATWLAQRGWDVTAVDFSEVGLDRGRTTAAALGADVTARIAWVRDDVRTWQPPEGTSYDLVLVAYLHLTEDVMVRARDWLAPGGRLVVVGHALRNLTEGVGGPQDARLLHTPEQLARAAEGLSVERLGEVLRETPHGTAVDLCLVARRT